MNQPSVVTWKLEAAQAGTQLHLCHSGLCMDTTRAFVSPVHFWQGQTQAQIGSQNGARMTGLAAFALDFEGEWEERLAQLAEKLPDLKCYIPER